MPRPWMEPGFHPRVPEPTDARPGTQEKLAAMRERALRGEELWVEGDATFGEKVEYWEDRPGK